MVPALIHLVPLALAAALSSVPITATIFILLSKSPTRPGLAFLAGTVLGTFATLSLAAVAGQALPGRPRQHTDLANRLQVALGVVMVLLGVVTLARRTRSAGGRRPGWLDGIGSLGTVPVFGIGLALNLRPKALLLVAAAGLAISGAQLPFNQNLVLVVLYTAIASCTVGVPIVVTILFPRQMIPRVDATKDWIATHSRVVGGAILILVGGFLTGIGLSG
jgi:hypothetical protein